MTWSDQWRLFFYFKRSAQDLARLVPQAPWVVTPMDYSELKFPKPLPRKTIKAKAKRQALKVTQIVRATVFAATGGRCVACGRQASQLHEKRPRSLGGKVSETNSIPLCETCHAKAHRLRMAKAHLRQVKG